MVMNKRILLGIDTDLSPTTQYALQTFSEFIEQSIPHVSIFLLNVIPLGQMISTHAGIYTSQVYPTSVPNWQREQAQETLARASTFLQKRGVPRERIETIIRIGAPAEEIVHAAEELQIRLLVVGSHASSFQARIRRILIGSTSRRVLQLAPCPVMIIIAPHASRPTDLAVWYETALRRYLQESANKLTIFTPRQAAQQFLPPHTRRAERKEIAAATLALEQLAKEGILFHHYVKGEVSYVND